jgi:hypothetical protein
LVRWVSWILKPKWFGKILFLLSIVISYELSLVKVCVLWPWFTHGISSIFMSCVVSWHSNHTLILYSRETWFECYLG